MMAEERRRFRRFPAPLHIEYRVPGAARAASSKSLNLSRGGILLSVLGSLLPAENLDLKITIPQDENPIFASAKVVWMGNRSSGAEAQEAGLEFSRIANVDRSRMLDYAYERWLSSEAVGA